MRKNKGIWLISLLLAGMATISGCQKTPEESAVASKAGGLNENVIAKPLAEGETRTLELPERWTASEVRSNDRVTLTVDLPMESVMLGNLPVIEMKSHVMTEEELQKLVDYFAGSEPLYVPEVRTKEVYQHNIDRIENAEGAFANVSDLIYIKSKGAIDHLEKAKKLAPEEQQENKNIEVKFQEKNVEESWFEAMKFYLDDGTLKSVEKQYQEKSFFIAEVGEERNARISAVTYNPNLNKSNSFSWETGAAILREEEITYEKGYREGMWARNGEIPDSYWKKEEELFGRIQDTMDGESMTPEEGKKQAEKVLAELGIQDMTLLAEKKILWFPKDTYPAEQVIAWGDDWWQADLTQAKTGYEYTFSRTVNGLPVDQMDGSFILNETDGTYAPPFLVETIAIAVTEDGLQSFLWDGMGEEVSRITENTTLLSLEEIQEKIFDQIYYYHSSKGQPAESKTKFTYEIVSAALGYTYVTAYEKPENAWLVPAWFFKVNEHVDDVETGVEYDRPWSEYMINALDGGMIGKPVKR